MQNVSATLLIAIGSLALGYITGVYLPLRFRQDDKKPKISIGPFQTRQNYFEITNHGGDLLNLAVRINWLQDGTSKNRPMESFFHAHEDPATALPHQLNSLKKGETKKVSNCPAYSDTGEVTVFINGKDIDGREYSDILILENGKRKLSNS